MALIIMEYVLNLHVFLWWVIIAMIAVIVISFVAGLVRRQSYDLTADLMMRLLAGLLIGQSVVGLVFLIGDGIIRRGFQIFFLPDARIEHGLWMLGAIGMAHLPARWKKSPDQVRYQIGLLAVLGVIVVMTVSLFRLSEA